MAIVLVYKPSSIKTNDHPYSSQFAGNPHQKSDLFWWYHNSLKLRDIERHDAENTGDETGRWESEKLIITSVLRATVRELGKTHPSHENEAELAPVDGTEIVVHQSNTHGRTDQALSGGNGECQSRSEQDSDSSTQFDGETTGRRHLSDLVAKAADDVETVHPETETEQETGNNQEPHRSSVLSGYLALVVGLVRSSPRANGIGHIVGTMRN